MTTGRQTPSAETASPASPGAPPRKRRRWRPRRTLLAEVLLVAVLLASTVAVLGWHADEQNFSVDESRWISTSRYFWFTFIDGDVLGPPWQPNYLILTHPPVARYLIGFGLWAQGWTPDRLNGRYDTDRSRDYNRERGNIPSPDLLDAARRVVLVFGVAATMLLYPVGRLLGGQVAGTAAVVLALANPLLATLWTRALAESILAFFSVLAFLLALAVARAGARPRRLPYLVPLGLGVALGLAAATKLTGVFVGLGVGLFAVVQWAARWRAVGRRVGPGLWLDALLATILIFVVVNPLLYPNPVMRTVMLFEHRRDEMQQQAIGTPRLAVAPDLAARGGLLYRRTFLEFGTVHSRTGLPLDGMLALVGLGIVGLTSWRALRRTGEPPAQLLLVNWTLATYLLSTVNLGFDSSHYFALPVLLATLLEAVALATIIRGLAGWVRRRQPRLIESA